MIHFNFKSYFIILIMIIGVVLYKYIIPYVRHVMLHSESKELYNSLDSDSLLWKKYAQSEDGRGIYLLELGNGEKTTVIFGAFHGDEQNGFHLAVQLGRELYKDPKLINGRVVIVPVVNPDGLMDRSRTNSKGVDINRNFPAVNWSPVYEKKKYYPGPESASEVETRIVIGILNEFQPHKIISIHADLEMNNYNGPAEELAQEMARFNGYPVTNDVGYPTPGSFGAYAGEELGIPVVTLELPDNSPEEAWEQNREALISAINF